jgi:hypothetical protein
MVLFLLNLRVPSLQALAVLWNLLLQLRFTIYRAPPELRYAHYYFLLLDTGSCSLLLSPTPQLLICSFTPAADSSLGPLL